MSKRLVAVVLLLAACGKPPGGDRDGANRGSPSAAPSAAAIAPPASQTPAGRSTGSPVPLPAVAGGQPLDPSSIQPAPAGLHLYDETGFQKISGCFASEGPPPTPTELKIEPPAGNRQQIEHDRTDERGRGMVSLAVVEYRPEGAFLAYLRQTQSIPFSNVTEFEANPPVLIVPSSPSSQRPWTFVLTSKDGKMKVETASHVAAASEEVRSGGGKTHQAMRVVSRSKVSGQSQQGRVDLTVDSTSWYSLEARLEIKEVSDTSGTVGLCELSSHEESVLR